jgi:hypothetical protein
MYGNCQSFHEVFEKLIISTKDRGALES